MKFGGVTAAVLVGSVVSALPSSVLAAGFALQEQSPRAMGHAFAGASAGLADASTVYFNPAGLTALDAPQSALGANIILTAIDFEDRGSAYPALGGLPIGGGNDGDAGDTMVLGSLFCAMPLSERLALGLGVYSPYGLSVTYTSGWVGRYQAMSAELRSVAIAPALAMVVADWLSVGAGFSAQYVEADLSNAVDFGSLLGVGPGTLDGTASIEAGGWDYGFNVGAVVTPRAGSRVGIHYRGRVNQTLSGDARFGVPADAAPLTASGLFVDTTGEVDLDLPDSIGIGIAQQCGESVVLLADALLTRWSSFDELRIAFDSAQPDDVTDESWEDVWRLAVGLEYSLDETWTVRGGAAYDQSPIPDVAHRTPRIPDSDRTWFAVGLGYRSSATFSLDVAYMFVAFDDAAVDRLGETGDLLKGDYEGSAHVVSLQLVCRI